MRTAKIATKPTWPKIGPLVDQGPNDCTGQYWAVVLDGLRSSQCISVHIRSLRVDPDQSRAYLVHSELCVGWDGMVIIGHRSSKSTFGAYKCDWLIEQ